MDTKKYEEVLIRVLRAIKPGGPMTLAIDPRRPYTTAYQDVLDSGHCELNETGPVFVRDKSTLS